ncbi:MAG: tol-pal system YbgF family protein [bacterium]
MKDHRPESLLLAAQALAQTGELQEALEELKRLESQSIGGRVGSEIRLNLGLIHEELENFEKASEWFSAVRDDKTDFFNDEALFHLAIAHEELGQLDQAREYLDELEDFIDDDAELREAVERARNRLSRQNEELSEQLRQYDF